MHLKIIVHVSLFDELNLYSNMITTCKLLDGKNIFVTGFEKSWLPCTFINMYNTNLKYKIQYILRMQGAACMPFSINP